MNKLLTLLLLAALVVPASAEVFIGIYTDEDPGASATDYTIVPYAEFTLYVVAHWSPGEVGEGITAAEFNILNLPVDAGYPIGLVGIEYPSDLIIGDLYTDLSIAWPAPVGGAESRATIATITITPFDPEWIPQDIKMFVQHGDACFCLVVVDDLFEIIDANGRGFTLNCTDECDFTASYESSWSTLKSAF